LAWKTVRQERNGNPAGFLALLLAILMLFLLKDVLKTSGSDRLPCDDPFFVQIEGDVKHPGVYPLCVRPTLAALIEAAGIVTTDCPALASGDNPLLKSGQKVVFHNDGRKMAISKGEMSAFYKITVGLPISLNHESEEGLTALPGVGPRLAEAIVQERSKRGGFRDLREVAEVSGIGSKLYHKIRPYLIL
jgi:competence protein ComEA